MIVENIEDFKKILNEDQIASYLEMNNIETSNNKIGLISIECTVYSLRDTIALEARLAKIDNLIFNYNKLSYQFSNYINNSESYEKLEQTIKIKKYINKTKKRNLMIFSKLLSKYLKNGEKDNFENDIISKIYLYFNSLITIDREISNYLNQQFNIDDCIKNGYSLNFFNELDLEKSKKNIDTINSLTLKLNKKNL